MASLPRGRCPICGAEVALRKGGLAREHGRYGGPDRPGVLLERVCVGSGHQVLYDANWETYTGSGGAA